MNDNKASISTATEGQYYEGEILAVLKQMSEMVKSQGLILACICLGLNASIELVRVNNIEVDQGTTIQPFRICEFEGVPCWFVPTMSDNEIEPIAVLVPGAGHVH